MKNFLLTFVLLILAGAANARQLIYEPLLPSQGGNPLLSSYFLSIAQLSRPTKTTPKATLEERLAQIFDRSVESEVSLEIRRTLRGEDGAQREFPTSDRVVVITPTDSGVQIDIYEKIDLGGGKYEKGRLLTGFGVDNSDLGNTDDASSITAAPSLFNTTLSSSLLWGNQPRLFPDFNLKNPYEFRKQNITPSGLSETDLTKMRRVE